MPLSSSSPLYSFIHYEYFRLLSSYQDSVLQPLRRSLQRDPLPHLVLDAIVECCKGLVELEAGHAALGQLQALPLQLRVVDKGVPAGQCLGLAALAGPATEFGDLGAKARPAALALSLSLSPSLSIVHTPVPPINTSLLRLRCGHVGLRHSPQHRASVLACNLRVARWPSRLRRRLAVARARQASSVAARVPRCHRESTLYTTRIVSPGFDRARVNSNSTGPSIHPYLWLTRRLLLWSPAYSTHTAHACSAILLCSLAMALAQRRSLRALSLFSCTRSCSRRSTRFARASEQSASHACQARARRRRLR